MKAQPLPNAHREDESGRQAKEASPPAALAFDSKLLEERGFWLRCMSGWSEAASIPGGLPLPPEPGPLLGGARMVIDGALYERLAKVTGAGPFLLYTTLVLTLRLCLCRYTALRFISVGSPPRRAPDGLDQPPNAVLIAGEIDERTSFKQLLLQQREALLEAYARQGYPYHALCEDLKRGGIRAAGPLFRIAVSLAELHGALPEVGHDLAITFDRRAERVIGEVAFSVATYRPEAVDRLRRCFLNLLASGLARPDAPAEDLDTVSAAEREALLATLTGPAACYPRDHALAALFQLAAERGPDAAALVFGDQAVSYGALAGRARRLASRLRRLGVERGALVAVCARPSAEMVAAIVAVLYAGAAYLPLDPDLPPDRLQLILDDAQAAVLLVPAELADRFPSFRGRRELLGAGQAPDALAADDRHAAQCSADDLAYVIYTSGSTGRPKGVAVPQRAVARLVLGTNYVHLGRGDRVAQASSMSFDAATFEIWGALLNGACLVGVPHEVALSPSPLAALLEREQITVLFLTPALFSQMAREAPRGFSGLQTLLIGGDRMDPEAVRLTLRAHPPRRLLNVYGPTESTTFATWFQVLDAPAGADGVPIGRPIAGTRVRLLGKGMLPVPPGARGEIFLGGDGLAWGYVDDPALTAERFLPDPWAGDDAGARLYRTGDFGRLEVDDAIAFLGRTDHQVKLRGFRVELGEIEIALRGHPEVAEAVVVVREDEPDTKQLVAYVVPAETRQPSVQALREHLAGRLPVYMLPGTFVILAALPLNAHGKIDRQRLPVPARQRSLEEPRLAPRTPVEQVLANFFADVLGIEDRVGIHDGFFVLGGHSLLATRLISRVRDRFQIELPIRDLFEHPTVSELAAVVEAAATTAARTRWVPIERLDRDGPLPLSFAQQRLWFIDRFQPGGSTYNVFAGFRLAGPLEVAALAAALREVVRRHEVLRTVFSSRDGTPEQVVLPAGAVLRDHADLRALAPAAREAELHRLAERHALRPFDLARDPMLRTLLVRYAAAEHVLLVTIHHIVSDAWSIGVLTREVESLYVAACRRQPSPLPELPVQYADFAAWQRQWMNGDVLAAEIEFWRRQLRSLPSLLELPIDRPRPPIPSSAGRTVAVAVPPAAVEPLRAVCHLCGVTPFMALLALFEVLLRRHGGQELFAVGTPVACRNRSELEGLIGFFVNMLVLRADFTGNPGYEGLLGRVRENALEAYLHQDLPFEKLVEEVQPERTLQVSPLYQVIFVLEQDAIARLHLRDMDVIPLAGFTPTQAHADLELIASEDGEGMFMELLYRRELFDHATVQRMAAHLVQLLTVAPARPSLPLDELPLLSAAERGQLVREWNDTARAAAGTLSHTAANLAELFAAQVRRTPAAVALATDGVEISYSDLDGRAGRLARRLRELGVEPEVRVALWLPRSAAAVVAQLGVLKAGGCYVPLDLEQPHQRQAAIVEDARPAVSIVEEGAIEQVPPGSGTAVLALTPDGELAGAGPEEPAAGAEQAWTRPGPENLAYVLFTSGSTGRPKGVMITHRGIVNHMAWILGAFPLGPADRMLLKTPLTFDASVWELFAPLLVGGCLVVAPPGEERDAGRLVTRLLSQRITALQVVPALLEMLVEQQAFGACRDLRRIYTGGEVLQPELRDACASRLQVELVNVYGPTEVAITASSHRCAPREPGRVPIGRPIDNGEVVVADAGQALLPLGVPGELLLGGLGLARGYVGRPDLTAERFIPDPFSGRVGERLYRSGDRGRWTTAGELEYLGRTDHQVKIRGHRIELGEIESILARHPALREAAVVARDEMPGGTALVAFVAGIEVPIGSELRSFLGRYLPDVMLPRHFVTLEALPHGAHGKVDRQRLLEWDLQALRPAAGVAPRDHVELAIAQLWEELLDRPANTISIRDDFFALGGHSLLAARLVAALSERLEQQIPLHLVFQHPTVEQLATVLREAGTLPPAPLLVAIQPRGSRPPIVWVHPTGGGISCYLDLARLLAPEQPFLALQASGIDGRRPLLPTVEEMAACYVQELLAAQPTGPYRLGGWSMGGLIAFEMARQLQGQGRDVASLTVLDYSVAEQHTQPGPISIALLLGFAKDLGLSAERLPDPGWLAASTEREKLDYLLQQAREQDLLPPGLAGDALLEVFRTNLRAMARYRPAPYSDALTLLRAASPGPAAGEDPTLGWGSLAAEVEVRLLPGDHFTLLRQPNVEALAAVLLGSAAAGAAADVASLQAPGNDRRMPWDHPSTA